MMVLVMLMMIVPVMGQEVTPEPDVAVVVDVPADGVADGDSFSVNVITIVIGLLGAFATGGIVGIAGVAQYVNRIKDDVSTVTAIEGLANSYPPQTKELIESIFRTIKNIGELGVEVFDGVPIEDKVAGDGLGDTPLVEAAG